MMDATSQTAKYRFNNILTGQSWLRMYVKVYELWDFMNYAIQLPGNVLLLPSRSQF